MEQNSYFIPLKSTSDRLHIKRFRDPSRPLVGAALLLHGAIENGRIFYNEKGTRGLAPYLAGVGFDVFACDLRGRGLSTPAISRSSKYGQTDAIVDELWAFAEFVNAEAPEMPKHWLAHSWGGVLMASHLVRFPEHIKHVESMTWFGTKRRICVSGREKFVAIDLVWKRAAVLASLWYGYLPGKKLKMGSDNETRQSLADSLKWIAPRGPWIDPNDGFDYGAAAKLYQLPRTLALGGPRDLYLGHPEDSKRFIAECQLPAESFHLLAKSNGNLHDYDHINMLTHPDGTKDHFPLLVEWLKEEKRPIKVSRYVGP